MTDLVIRFICFCIVGTLGMCLDFLLTWVIKEKLKINKYVANTSGFIVAASSNYILNRLWTFASHNPYICQEYIRFLFISLLGLIINTLLLWTFHKKMSFYLAKLFAIAITTAWNFFMNQYITFNVFSLN